MIAVLRLLLLKFELLKLGDHSGNAGTFLQDLRTKQVDSGFIVC